MLQLKDFCLPLLSLLTNNLLVKTHSKGDS